jgi:hypothetical protein
MDYQVIEPEMEGFLTHSNTGHQLAINENQIVRLPPFDNVGTIMVLKML